jgi:CRP-like cAMP-binding protein
MSRYLSNAVLAQPLPGAVPVSGLGLSNNHLLAALPEADRRQLSLGLELVPVRAGHTLAGAGLASTYAWFPLNCIVSLLYSALDGGMAEVAVIGCEGMVGLGLFIGGGSDSCEAVAQCPGFAYRMRLAALKDCFNRSAPLRELLMQYMQSLLTQSSQSALCNRHHAVEQQLCRWLLSAADRLHSDKLAITQESIANTLGVRRAGITEAACRLQRDGLIRYRRGDVELLDRPGLERRACECYAVLRKEALRFAPAAPAPACRLRLQHTHALEMPRPAEPCALRPVPPASPLMGA